MNTTWYHILLFLAYLGISSIIFWVSKLLYRLELSQTIIAEKSDCSRPYLLFCYMIKSLYWLHIFLMFIFLFALLFHLIDEWLDKKIYNEDKWRIKDETRREIEKYNFLTPKSNTDIDYEMRLTDDSEVFEKPHNSPKPKYSLKNAFAKGMLWWIITLIIMSCIGIYHFVTI